MEVQLSAHGIGADLHSPASRGQCVAARACDSHTGLIAHYACVPAHRIQDVRSENEHAHAHTHTDKRIMVYACMYACISVSSVHTSLPACLTNNEQ